jgi:hypothetical protein
VGDANGFFLFSLLARPLMIRHCLAARVLIAISGWIAMAEEKGTYTNPVYSSGMPDPGVLVHDGNY